MTDKLADEVAYWKSRADWAAAMNAKLMAGQKADDGGATDWIAARDKLVEALRWYAENPGPSYLYDDGGDLAEKTLAEFEGRSYREPHERR